MYSPNSVFEKIALSDINLKIMAGETVGIIGHTGSGKSTLIQHFNALLKPTSGEVLVDGVNIHNDKAFLKKIRQRIGLVFQYPEHQLFEVSVYKDVAFGPTLMGLSSEEVDKNVRDALKAVGLGEEFHDKSPFELSGGEKRRTAIAGVLAMRPEVLILDEPAAGLDPQGKAEIFAQIKKMKGITVIIVSHSMDDAAALAQRIIVMNKGKIELDSTPSDVFAQGDFLKKIGLDTPQISRLMNRLNALNPLIPTHAFTVEDAARILLNSTNGYTPTLN
ncbi:MAG: energy-coupling factor transporter ATPase [Defluviitaleaceae bacterium]|nr:energy-coupling factor transporter ATPase [Defluviitaleaceae bacterium]